MSNWLPKNCFNCCGARSRSDGFTEEVPSLKNCLGKFFSSRLTIGGSTLGLGSGITFCSVAEAAVHLANSSGIAGEIGRYTVPWIAMATVGGISGVVLAGCVICYCCSKAGQQDTNLSNRLVGSTYEIDSDPRFAYYTDDSD